MKEIQLTKGFKALIDDEDFEVVSKFKWHVQESKKKYATRFYAYKKNTKKVYLHRFLLNPEKGKIIDHINGNSLDNRRSNLRVCSYAENNCNKIPQKNRKYKGAYWVEEYKFWVASIGFNKKTRHLGCFKTEEEAAKAYDIAAKKQYGQFAKLNFGSM